MQNNIRVHFCTTEEEVVRLEVSIIGVSLVRGTDKILQVHPAIGKTVTEQLQKFSKEITFKILPSGWYSCEIPEAIDLYFKLENKWLYDAIILYKLNIHNIEITEQW
jgi:hypothetical protein